MKKFAVAIGFATLVYSILLSQLALAQNQSITTLVKEGDPTPIGGTFRTLGKFSFNDSGGLLFYSEFQRRSSALFLASTGGISVIVDPGNEFEGLGTITPGPEVSQNDQGGVAFTGALFNKDGVRQGAGVFIITNEATLVALSGQTSLIGGEYSEGFDVSANSLNNSGELAFKNFVSVGNTLVQAIFLFDGSAVSKVVVDGEATPLGGTYENVNLIAINDASSVLFSAEISGATAREALFLYQGGNISKVVATGDPAPGNMVYSFEHPREPTTGESTASINNRGDIVFSGSITDLSTQTEEFGIFLVSNGTISQVVTTGQPIPGGGNMGLFLAPTINESGQIAFLASKSVADADNFGLFFTADGQIAKIAQKGEATPLGGTWQNLHSFGTLRLPKINAGGLIAFWGQITGGSASGGLFLSDGLSGGPRLSVSPDIVFFATVAIGETDSQPVTITSIGSEPLDLQSITVAPAPLFGLENLPALPLTLQPGEQTTFNVTFMPEQNATSTNGQLTIQSNAVTGAKVVDLIEPVIVSDLEITVDSEVKAGQFSAIQVKTLDQDGNVNTDYFGNVRFKLLQDEDGKREIDKKESTEGIGRLNTTISLIDEGVSENIFLFTPEEQFTSDRPINDETVISGTAFIAVEVEDPVMRDTVRVDVKSPLDIFIEEIEVQQGVVDLGKAVEQEFKPGEDKVFPALPFIAEHQTAIRVPVKFETLVPFSQVEITGIEGKLRISGPGGAQEPITFKSSLDKEFTLRDSGYSQEDTVRLRHGLFTILEPEKLQDPGEYTFEVTLKLDPRLHEITDETENNVKDTTGTFVETNSFKLLAVIGLFEGSTAPDLEEGVLGPFELVEKAYPIQRSKFEHTDPNSIQPWMLKNTFSRLQTYAQLHYRFWLYNRENSTQYEKLIVFTDFAGLQNLCPGVGSGCVPNPALGKYGIVFGNTASGVAHELGHTLGLGDTYESSTITPREFDTNPRRSDAVDGGNLVDIGNMVLLLDSDILVTESHRVTDFMGSTGNWIDRTTWNHLYNTKFGVRASNNSSTELITGDELTTDFVVISGVISNDDSVLLNPFLKLPQVPEVSTPGDGEYALEFLRQDGTLLSSFQFEVDFIVPDLGEVSDVPFSIELPLSDETREISIVKNTTQLISRALSENPPEVQITSPADGEQISGVTTLSWTGSDPDGDDLTYSIIYSADGSEQMVVEVNLNETSYEWSSSFYPASQAGSITIVANDGINEGRDTASNLRVGSSETLSPPLNLTVAVSGDSVFLDWDSPIPGTPTLAKYSGSYRPKSAIQNAQRKPPTKPFYSPITMSARTDIEETEPNNNPQQAQVLSGESPLVVTGQVEISDVGDVVPELFEDDLEDLFKVTLTQPGLTIRLDQFTSDCDLYLLNADASQELANSTNIGATDPEAIDASQLPAGTYLIGVTIFDDDPIGPDTTSYQLTFDGSFGAGESLVVSFNIYRSPMPGARVNGTLINSVNGNTTTFLDVAPDGPEKYYQVTAVYEAGESPPSNEVKAVVTGISEFPSEQPESFALLQNFPNPFNPQTSIRYDLSNSTHVRLDIFNLRGQRIITLVDEQKPAGSYVVTWNGRNENGDSAASGIYVYRLKTEQFESTRKLILLR